ncbi:MAG: TonB-dependent receptor [Cytophagia bacterium]|nr:MAG: TonB-dependent receptor [Cytophagia bacterium]TAG40679.1 MAG: TonB-dependent receptor [Cytophagia bacterium]
MKIKIIFIYLIYCVMPFLVMAQNKVSGIVRPENQPKETLTGVSIFWENTQIGTTSDENGAFSLPLPDGSQRLIFSFIGFKNDTISVNYEKPLEIFLKENKQLQEVVIKDKKIDIETIKTEILTTKSLQKAACCNLSESFETNASVDVTITDAITGGKQLKLLGLDGVYSQIMVENMPHVRGLSARSGLHLISGTSIKSIEINKGAGSVVNGYESMTGQINVELAKPESSEKLLLNGFINPFGRWELNANTSQKINSKWSTAVLAHTSHLQNAIDQNMDGYMDTPKFSQYNLINRWKYEGKSTEAQFGFRFVNDTKLGGQSAHNHNDHQNQTLYGASAALKQYEAWSKIGFVSKKVEGRSVGFIFNAKHHAQNSFFGLNQYKAWQNTINTQVIYQTPIIRTHINTLRLGASFLSDNYDENWQAQIPDLQSITRQRYERTAGIFAEYTWKPTSKITWINGLRADVHNLFGGFLFPRSHFKYQMTDKTILRASAGRGMRAANPMTEQAGFLASSRRVFWANNLRPELAWNYGINLTQEFSFLERDGQISVDFYRTDFQNQVITDVNTAQNIYFYNLNGKSFANSFQIQTEYELFDDFNLTLAYKNYDIRATYQNIGLQNVPLVVRERFFANFDYTLKNKKTKEELMIDVTGEWLGRMNLPNTQNNPVELRRGEKSPSYWLLNAQITYKPTPKWDIYLGGEDLLNFMQNNPIIAGNQPFGNYFDASIIYAPVMGRMMYAGVRFYVK